MGEPHVGERGDGAVIRPYEDGPLLVRGSFVILDGDGEAIDAGRDTIALCRCGRSARKPFCDGSHKATGFRASAGDERAEPLPQRPRAVRGDGETLSGVLHTPEQHALP